MYKTFIPWKLRKRHKSPLALGISQIFLDITNALLLTDEMAPWLMIPYQNPVTPQGIAFNRLLKANRI